MGFLGLIDGENNNLHEGLKNVCEERSLKIFLVISIIIASSCYVYLPVALGLLKYDVNLEPLDLKQIGSFNLKYKILQDSFPKQLLPICQAQLNLQSPNQVVPKGTKWRLLT